MRVRELYGIFFCIWPGIKQGVINADNVFFFCLLVEVVGGGGGALGKNLGIGEPLRLLNPDLV